MRTIRPGGALVLMIHGWAQQGRKAMVALLSLVTLCVMSWQRWSLDEVLEVFQ